MAPSDLSNAGTGSRSGWPAVDVQTLLDGFHNNLICRKYLGGRVESEVERRGRRPRRRGRSGQGQTAANYNVQGGLWIPCAVTCTWPGAASVGRRASSPSRTLRTCTDALSCARTTKEASELAIRALEGVVERDLVGGRTRVCVDRCDFWMKSFRHVGHRCGRWRRSPPAGQALCRDDAPALRTGTDHVRKRLRPEAKSDERTDGGRQPQRPSNQP